MGPTYGIEYVTHLYPGRFRSIKDVDFRNLNNGRFRLRNGHYKHDEQFDHYSVDLDSVQYLDATTAVAIYSWFEVAVSSESGSYAIVYTLSKDRLQSVQSIDWETHSAGTRPTWSFDPKTNTLLIRSDHYMPGDAHCCISAVDVVTFRWDGNQFNQTGVTTEPLRREPGK